jgi:rhodanese-related sulfurtransferase
MRIQPSELQQDLQAGRRVALIDVRTPVEFAETHIAGSHLMPLDTLDPQAVADATRGADRCVLVCQSGTRAGRALQKLKDAGCGGFAVLDGGVGAWQSAGLDVVRSESKRLPLMRQVQLVIGLFTLTGSILALAVNPNFAIIPAFFGAGLTFAGASGWCGLAILLSKMPWNSSANASCNRTSCSS